MEENMANILVSGLINTETTVRVRQFPEIGRAHV